jgi:glycosyltransferase involved in cell wall biosynthesis
VRVHLLLGLRVETMTGLGRVVQLAAERLTVLLSTETVAVGEGMRRRAAELGLDMREARVVGRGSANGVDVARFAAAGRELGPRTGSDADPDLESDTDILMRFEAGLGRTMVARRVVGLAPDLDGPVVGFVGRLAVDKGLDCLVAAVRLVRSRGVPAQLVLVGPDDGLDRLAPETRAALDEPWVVRPGLVSDTASVYAAFDVFCLPSRREGLPTVVLEAAAAGVPVVVSDATGTADTVDDGRTGLIVPVDDVGAWAAAIAGVLGDPGGASRRAVLGREFVREHFAADVVGRRLCDLYEGRLRSAGAVLPKAAPAPAPLSSERMPALTPSGAASTASTP